MGPVRAGAWMFLVAGAAAAFGGCGGSVVVEECAGTERRCGGDCVDPTSDADHCGACGRACEGECVRGACVPAPAGASGGDSGGGCAEGEACGGDAGGGCAEGEACGADCPCGFCTIASLPSSERVAFDGTTLGALDLFEPSCTPGGAGEAVLRYVAPSGGRYVFDTRGTTFDTLLASLSACIETGCNDDFEGQAAHLDLELAEGEEILVVVEGVAGAAGPYRLNVEKDGPRCPDGLAYCDDGSPCVDLDSDPENCGHCYVRCAADESCIDATCR